MCFWAESSLFRRTYLLSEQLKKGGSCLGLLTRLRPYLSDNSATKGENITTDMKIICNKIM